MNRARRRAPVQFGCEYPSPIAARQWDGLAPRSRGRISASVRNSAALSGSGCFRGGDRRTLRQTGFTISTRSVKRVIADYGLRRKGNKPAPENPCTWSMVPWSRVDFGVGGDDRSERRPRRRRSGHSRESLGGTGQSGRAGNGNEVTRRGLETYPTSTGNQAPCP